ncbi:MAG TPA: hypothetical protein VGU19_03290 [Microvirga sp.]|jgi:hypothetical protein|nr:hypothetical protein [Microvirga sp.]
MTSLSGYARFLLSELHLWAAARAQASSDPAYEAELKEATGTLTSCLEWLSGETGRPPENWPDIVLGRHVYGLGRDGAFHIWMAHLSKGRSEYVAPLVASLRADSPSLPAGSRIFVQVAEFIRALALEAARQADAHAGSGRIAGEGR